jgi:pimeloyl-ACP methyl ester carboxylesterase
LRLGNTDPVTVLASMPDVLDIGSGSTVVLLHSSLSTKRQWQSLIDRLAPNHRCIAFDLLGYGKAMYPADELRFSLAEEVYRIRTRLAALVSLEDAVHVVGHSYGGAVALRLAQDSSVNVGSLTLFEPVAFHLLPDTHGAVSMIRTVADCISREVVAARKSAKEPRIELAHKLLPATQLFVDFWSGHGAFDKFDGAQQLTMSVMLPKVALDFQALLTDPTKLSRLRPLRVPTCLLGGRLSPRCTHQLLYVLEATLPHVELNWVPAGHLAPITDAVRVNPLIENFIDRIDTRRHASKKLD